MDYSFNRFERAVKRMSQAFECPVSAFKLIERPNGKTKTGRVRGHIIRLRARYMDTEETVAALKKWRLRLQEFYCMRFTIEAYCIDVSRYMSVDTNKTAPGEDPDGDYGGGEMRV